MKNRIRFITHKDKQILLADASNLSGEELVQLAPLVLSRVTAEPRGSVLLLADFGGSKVDKKSLEALKPALVIDRPQNADVPVERLTQLAQDASARVAQSRGSRQDAGHRILRFQPPLRRTLRGDVPGKATCVDEAAFLPEHTGVDKHVPERPVLAAQPCGPVMEALPPAQGGQGITRG